MTAGAADRSCCSHLGIVSRDQYVGGHHPACPVTSEIQAELGQLRTLIRAWHEAEVALTHAELAEDDRPGAVEVLDQVEAAETRYETALAELLAAAGIVEEGEEEVPEDDARGQLYSMPNDECE